MSETKHVIVVGGGISGLATAYYLNTHARDKTRVTVLEAESRLGGKILTERANGFVIEGGPESFVTRKPWALELCRELGLGERLLGADDAGRNYVWHRGRLERMPTRPMAFLRSPLLSFKGKLRAAQELVIPTRAEAGDESLGDFVRRRFGEEVLNNLVAPAVGSVYLSDVNRLSTQVSFDRFRRLEREHGSVLRGMMAMQRAAKPSDGIPSARPPQFVTLPCGLGELIETLAQRLHDFGSDVRVNACVQQIERNSDAYRTLLADGTALDCDALVLAIPTPAMANLLAPHSSQIAERLRRVRYVSVATIVLAYPRGAMPPTFDGFGVVVPEREPSQLIACEVMTNKYPSRAPKDVVLLRAFAGGHRNEALVNQADAALIGLAQRELSQLLKLRGEPMLARVFRWTPGNPQYPVGHLHSLAVVEAELKRVLPNVFLTGAALRGLGIPDCVRQAKETAAQALTATAQATQPQVAKVTA